MSREQVDQIERDLMRILARARVRQCMTQVELGDRVDIGHSSTISKLESGDRGLRYGEAVLIARALGHKVGVGIGGCRICVGQPPAGFTCNACGAKGRAI